MRILIFQDYLRGGGTEHHALFLAEALAQQGHDSTLVTFRPGGDLDPVNRRVPYRRITLQKFDSRLSWWAPAWSKPILSLSPDLILLFGRNAHRLGRGIKREFPQVKLVATLRTGRSLPAFYLNSLREADGIVVNSHYALTRLETPEDSGPPPKGPVTVILNPLLKCSKVHDIAEERIRFRNHHGILPDEEILLQVASLIPGKNHRELLQLLAGRKTEKPWKLWIVGSGPFEKQLREKTRQLGIENKVFFWGFQSNILPFLAGADIFVTTSREESLPNAVIEAQAAGLPVVAYKTAGIPECVEGGKTAAVVPSDDSEGWLSALEEVSGWLHSRPELRENCRKFALDQFCPEAALQRYQSFFEQILR